MQIGELTSIVQALVPWLTSKWEIIASGLFAIGLFLWVCARTGSTHILHKRLWRLVLGKQELKSTVLSAFLSERDDLMQVRSMMGLKRLPTTAAAERLVGWLKKYDVDVDLVAAAGHHFDLDAPGFTRPPPSFKAMMVVMLGAIVFLYGGITVGGLGANTPPVVQVKESKIWYAVTDGQAQRFNLHSSSAEPTIEPPGCSDTSATSQSTGYPKHDVQVMCELLSTEGGKAALRKAHRGQIALATIFAVALLVVGTLLSRAMWRKAKAIELYKLVERRKSDAVRHGLEVASQDVVNDEKEDLCEPPARS